MNNDVKETIKGFLSVYEQANDLPILRPMSYGQCSYLLSVAVFILQNLDTSNESITTSN